MASKSTQVSGAGNCQDINADSGQSQANRLYTLTGKTGKVLVHNGDTALDLAWKAGNDNTVDCTARANADGTIAPGVTLVVEAPGGFLSFVLVARTNAVAACEVR